MSMRIRLFNRKKQLDGHRNLHGQFLRYYQESLSRESKTTLLLVLGLLSSTMCSNIIFAFSHAQLLLFDSPPPEYWQANHLEFEQEGEA